MKARGWNGRGLLIAVLGVGVLLGGCGLLGNRPPVAVVAANPLSGTSPVAVAFDGTASFDPDGTIASYAWAFGDGGTANTALASHTFLAAVTHTYAVTLTVTDNGEAVDMTTLSIEVLPASSSSATKPTARVSATPASGAAPLVVSFDGSTSTTPVGTISTYAWDFGDGSTGSGLQISHTYSPQATTNYTVTLAVTNDRGETASTATLITASVSEVMPNDGPTAAFTKSAPVKTYDRPHAPGAPPDGPSLYEVTFDPSASTAAAGQRIDLYLWDFGDGNTLSTARGQPLLHTYASQAVSQTFVVRLTVIDDQGLRDSALGNVTVIDE